MLLSGDAAVRGGPRPELLQRTQRPSPRLRPRQVRVRNLINHVSLYVRPSIMTVSLLGAEIASRSNCDVSCQFYLVLNIIICKIFFLKGILSSWLGIWTTGRRTLRTRTPGPSSSPPRSTSFRHEIKDFLCLQSPVTLLNAWLISHV